MRLCHSYPPNFCSLRRSGLGATAEYFGSELETIKERFLSVSL